MKYWEIIADNLSEAGWPWGCISSTDREGRQFWVVAAERKDAGRFIVHAHDMRTAFLELQAAIHGLGEVGIKYWEIIADNLKKRGWSLGWVSAVDSQGRTIWIVDAHRDDGRRFIVRADEKVSVFVELESAIQASQQLRPREVDAHMTVAARSPLDGRGYRSQPRLARAKVNAPAWSLLPLSSFAVAL